MTHAMTMEQIRTQIAIRTAWEEKIHGGVSKMMQQMAASFSRKIKTESDVTFRDAALGEIIKRMNINNIPKDAKRAVYALDACDKLPREVIGNKLDNVPSDEKAMTLANIAWDATADFGHEIMSY